MRSTIERATSAGAARPDCEEISAATSSSRARRGSACRARRRGAARRASRRAGASRRPRCPGRCRGSAAHRTVGCRATWRRSSRLRASAQWRSSRTTISGCAAATALSDGRDRVEEDELLALAGLRGRSPVCRRHAGSESSGSSLASVARCGPSASRSSSSGHSATRSGEAPRRTTGRGPGTPHSIVPAGPPPARHERCGRTRPPVASCRSQAPRSASRRAGGRCEPLPAAGSAHRAHGRGRPASRLPRRRTAAAARSGAPPPAPRRSRTPAAARRPLERHRSARAEARSCRGSRTSARSSSEATICPPSAMSHKRFATTTAYRSSRPRLGSARRRSAPANPESVVALADIVAMDRLLDSIAQPTALTALANATIRPSPRSLTSSPPCAAATSRSRPKSTRRSRSASSSPSSERSSVEPTRSVKSNVTTAAAGAERRQRRARRRQRPGRRAGFGPARASPEKGRSATRHATAGLAARQRLDRRRAVSGGREPAHQIPLRLLGKRVKSHLLARVSDRLLQVARAASARAASRASTLATRSRCSSRNSYTQSS